MLLDNPAWNSITTKHKHLGVIGKKAVISDPNVAWVGAVNEETAEAYSELASIATPDIPILIVGTNVPEGLAEWNILQRLKVQQMICTKPVTYKPIEYEALTAADVPSMIKLVELTKPGIFKG